MSTILITGGTGHLGQEVVQLLKKQGDQVRILARTPGTDPEIQWVRGDLSTGAGIAEAVTGVDTIVHAATHSPAAQRGYLTFKDFVGSPDDVDVHGTRRLLEHAAKAGVDHFCHISIVGVQQSRLPYSKMKATAENFVREAATPWTIVAATPFFWLLSQMFDGMTKRGMWPLPSNLVTQPCDDADFAKYVVESIAVGPHGRRADFGGPQTLTLIDLARQYQTARGIDRRIVGLRLPQFALRAAGPQTCPEGVQGETTWNEWLTNRRQIGSKLL